MSLSYLCYPHLVHPVLTKIFWHGQQPRQNLSASLKARLSRSRRSFTTPSSVAKRLCVDVDDEDEENDGLQVVADPSVIVTKTPGHRYVAEKKIQVQSRTSGGLSEAELAPPLPAGRQTQKERLRRELRVKMDDLRRLNMVKVYRSKVDPVLQLYYTITIICFLSAKATHIAQGCL